MSKYQREAAKPHEDDRLHLVSQPFFLRQEEWIEEPADWHPRLSSRQDLYVCGSVHGRRLIQTRTRIFADPQRAHETRKWKVNGKTIAPPRHANSGRATPRTSVISHRRHRCVLPPLPPQRRASPPRARSRAHSLFGQADSRFRMEFSCEVTCTRYFIFSPDCDTEHHIEVRHP